MSRFFVENDNVNDNYVAITGTDVNHIKNVLRMAPGENLTAVDRDGNVYDCEIEKITDGEVRCRILEKSESDAEPKVAVVLLQGVPKGDKAELIIQKTVELGVSEIWPVVTERTIVRFENDKDKEKEVFKVFKQQLFAEHRSPRDIPSGDLRRHQQRKVTADFLVWHTQRISLRISVVVLD